MKYSYNWLKKISGTTKTSKELAMLLTMHAFQVEGITVYGNEFDGIVVGKILEIIKHPHADRLSITQVLLNEERQEIKQIVCGAQNIAVGQRVPVACVGAILSNGLTILERDVRGVLSYGMICSEDELGLGKDHSGIMVLNKDAQIGQDFASYLKIKDEIFDIDILPNRAHDSLSHIGIAREICACQGYKFSEKESEMDLKEKPYDSFHVENKAKDNCFCYYGSYISNVIIEDSPLWMRHLLKSIGIQSINNIVDVANYVMLECGQPLHVFDKDKITDQDGNLKITIEELKAQEDFFALDHKTYRLEAGDIVIKANGKTVAVAGIIGGKESSVTESTKKIVLETASFNPVKIRKTRTRLGLSTESSYRFEREITPDLVFSAHKRMIELLNEYRYGIYESSIKIETKSRESVKIIFNPEKANKLLGEEIATESLRMIFENLGIETVERDGQLLCTVPSQRLDITNQEDLVEEIGRIYGYHNIPSQPLVEKIIPPACNEKWEYEQNVKKKLTEANLYEMINYSFYSKQDSENLKLELTSHVELENPMSAEQSLMRTSLIPGILKNIYTNLKYKKEFGIFEIGNVFIRNSNDSIGEEKKCVCALVAEKKSEDSLFFELKGKVDYLFSQIHIEDLYYVPELKTQELWHKTRTAIVKSKNTGEKVIAKIGEIDPFVLRNFHIKQRVVLVEFSIDILKDFVTPEQKYEPIYKYPRVLRDMSMIVGKTVHVGDIMDIIQEIGKGLVHDIELFDIYKDDKEQKTSIAFHITFGKNNMTMLSSEADELIQRITIELEEKFDLTVRK